LARSFGKDGKMLSVTAKDIAPPAVAWNAKDITDVTSVNTFGNQPGTNMGINSQQDVKQWAPQTNQQQTQPNLLQRIIGAFKQPVANTTPGLEEMRAANQRYATSFRKEGGYLVKKGQKGIVNPAFENNKRLKEKAIGQATSNNAIKPNTKPADNTNKWDSIKKDALKTAESRSPVNSTGYKVPVKEQNGGYIKKTPVAVPVKSITKGYEEKKSYTTVVPKDKKGSKIKTKKCSAGCGCKKTMIHKQGGIISTVCSCCGEICN